MDLDKEYKFSLGGNYFLFKKNPDGCYTSKVCIFPHYDHYRADTLYVLLLSIKYKLDYYMGLNLTHDQLEHLQKLEEDDFLEKLGEACRSLNNNFWYSVPSKEEEKKKTCIDCDHFNVLDFVCRKNGGCRKKDDTCKDWKAC
jgi:hypothetical protein